VGRRLKPFLWVLVLLAALPQAAFAQSKLRAADSNAIQDCVKTNTGPDKNWERCIGTVEKTCIKDAASTADMIACISREQVVWDDILNETYRRLSEKLDAGQKTKLRDMQRAWIASREKTCAFYWDYFQGTMASPMSASCVNRATGRRALFLLGFLNDALDRK
jgi:uncharacterized protein YecT (DUF1311 family)